MGRGVSKLLGPWQKWLYCRVGHLSNCSRWRFRDNSDFVVDLTCFTSCIALIKSDKRYIEMFTRKRQSTEKCTLVRPFPMVYLAMTNSEKEHCIDQLRQVIMCWGSTAIVPLKYFEGYGSSYVKSDIVHTCRKFEPIREFVSERFNGSLFVPRPSGWVDEESNAF